MFKPLYTAYPLYCFDQGKLVPVDDTVVQEAELTIILNGRVVVSLACSPDDYPELAVGYLLAEGLITKYEQLRDIQVKGNQALIEADINGTALIDNTWHVNTCLGRCQSAIDDIEPLHDFPGLFRAHHLLTLVGKLNELAPVFQKTGGTHIAGLGCEEELLVSYEDIGRHNAVDKTLGYVFLNRIALHDKCLVLSGRIAGEILLKAARSRVGLILSRSAPTSKTVALADKLGITVVGFARGEKFNVYTHPQRIII